MGDNYFLLTNLLSEDERKVITSITAHIERGEKRVGIQQIAAENYLSTASIVKMCKRLGFDGYSELYYHLSRQLAASEKPTEETLRRLIDNYSADLISRFCALLHERRRGKIFTTGEGFSNIVGAYIVQRMSICGFMAFSNVHFYDYMLFQEAHQRADADEDAEIHRADHEAADHDHHAGHVLAHHPDGDQPAQRTGQQDAHRLRRDQPRALRRQQGDNQRQRHVGHIRRARAQQVDRQHRA